MSSFMIYSATCTANMSLICFVIQIQCGIKFLGRDAVFVVGLFHGNWGVRHVYHFLQ